MENYLNCKKLDTAINRAKKMLIDRARKGGVYENFGAREVRDIKSRFIDISDFSRIMNDNRGKINRFESWCMEYTAN